MQFLKYSDGMTNDATIIFLPIFEDWVPENTDVHTKESGIVGIAEIEGFSKKKGESFEYFDQGSKIRNVLVGLGKKEELVAETLRRSYSSAFKKVMTTKDGVILALLPGLNEENEAEEVVFSISLAAYDFDRFREEKNKVRISNVLIEGSFEDSVIERARKIADAVNYTRDVANLPPSVGTPTLFENKAKEIADLAVTVFGREDFIKLGMGGLEGVSRAAKESAKMVVMEYGPREEKATLIVGKGITFDSGGISLKPSPNMDEMKFDKCGACAVLGTMKLVSDLKLDRHVVGIMPLTENLPGGNAYKPGDILTHYNGVTSEILSTDAEGRLVLADALSYGVKNYNPEEVVDLATLTGACLIALGGHYAGLMGNNPELKEKIKKASGKSWEKVWELPIDEDFQEQIKSKVADIKNTGGRPGGAETAGAFLSRFVGKTKWAHLDIAGTAWTTKDASNKSYLPAGATGFGVRLLYEFLKES